MANETKTEAETPPRAPCPCGSGKRYKACHGKSAARATHSRVLRPFEGLAGEPDWVAMREIVPAATAELKLTGKDSDRSLQLSTVLPMAGPALVRQDGTIMLGCQTQTSSGDAARDIGDALQQALRAEPGTAIAPRPLPADAPRVQDLIDSSVAPRVVVHSGFDYWVDDAVELDAAASASMERANGAVMPTARLAAVEAAYWIVYGERRQLRWVLARRRGRRRRRACPIADRRRVSGRRGVSIPRFVPGSWALGSGVGSRRRRRGRPCRGPCGRV